MYHLHKLYQDFLSPDLEAVRMMSVFTSLTNLQDEVRELSGMITQKIINRREYRQAG